MMTKELIDFLSTKDISENLPEFLKHIEKLNQIIIYVENPPPVIEQHSISLKKVKPEVLKMKNLVCSRAFKFLISQINNLLKPNTNF
jgi:hypothetical protein